MSKCYLKASLLVDTLRFQLTLLFSVQNICRLEPEEQTCPNLFCDRTSKHA